MLTDLANLSAAVVSGNATNGATTAASTTTPSQTGQHWSVVNTSYNGQSGLVFESSLSNSYVLELNTSSGHVSLGQSLTGTNQMWWLASSTTSGAYYIHSLMASDCLTDNGLGLDLTVAPCVTGNPQQIWYLP